ncbi:hypothetical protein D3C76_1646130 [compost metagenome]
MRAQPNTSVIACCCTSAIAAGLFCGASRNSGPPSANSARRKYRALAAWASSANKGPILQPSRQRLTTP